MPPDLTPDSIRGATFRTTLRGADTSEVSSFLAEVARLVEDLQRDRDQLASRLGEFADKDLKSEFEAVGREVTVVLEAAREAAESMRERASADAARWRSESMAEAEQTRKEAKNDAEALRGDAWTTGSDLLAQTTVEAKRVREAAERDSLTITGEAEREAHRLISSARREAEDLVRSATMTAEKVTAEAEKERDSMIESARRESEASQERTRALERRREELMEELEGVRAALRQMEGTLEAKREDLNLSKTGDTSVRVIPGRSSPSQPQPQQSGSDWEPGETVRIVRQDGDEPDPPDAPEQESEPQAPAIDVVEAPPLEPPVARSTQESPPLPETRPEPEPEAEPAAPPQPPAEAVAAPARSQKDDVGALFASLRNPGETSGADAPSREVSPPSPEPQESDGPIPDASSEVTPRVIRTGDNLLEARDALLLPVTNRALRGVKRAVAEAQNIALDGLRTDSAWLPDRAEVSEILRADLITLWAESHAAGHERAEAMTGAKLKRPPTPTTDSPEVIGAAIATDLERELAAVGDGQRERQAAASKVFRAWRTDESERRVRSLALAGFHTGLVRSSAGFDLEWVAAGAPCTACRSAAEDPRSSLPPIHGGCECTVVVIGA